MNNLAHSHQRTMDELPARPISALALVETVTAAHVFVEKGLDPILTRIETEARSLALDISTDKGRKEIASLAHKIAKSKTALDKMGKDLVAGWKDQAKKVDLERSRAWDFLESLQKEIRQPLTEWEDREKNRVAAHEAALSEISSAGPFTLQNWQSLSVQTMQDRLTEIQADKRDWQEFAVRAKLAIETSIAAITSAIAKRQKHDAEQAELARLRKEEEERKQREHEERLKAAAAEKARIEAEEKARKTAEAEAARVKAEREQAEKERQRIQREKDAAEARAVQAEKDRIAAEQKHKEAARIAAENAAQEKKDAEAAAAKRERDRIEAEKAALAEAVARREADKVHRQKVNSDAVNGLLRAVIVSGEDEFAEIWEEALARRIVEAIAKGQIPHITISY